ncbi:MAG: hypothetical protein KGI71_05195 [Patescibacteria group bacterium]|nr:hypothetical protein [Patescibacteria group bacterium]
MIGVAFALLRPFLPYLIALVAFGGAYLWADVSWCNHACTVQKSAASTLRGQIAKAEQRATYLALLWSAQVEKSAQALQEQRNHDAAAYAELESRSRNLSALASCYLSNDALGLLDAATGNANTSADPAGNLAAPGPIPLVPKKPL